MTTLAFDAIAFTKTLREAGINPAQAEAMAIAFRNANTDLDVVTKKDLALSTAEIKADINLVKGEMSTLKWMMGMLIGLAVANFAKQFF